jgi:hypothetical protein
VSCRVTDRAVSKAPRSNDVFINCPFDDGYRPIFNAFVFAICDLGFVPRCAREADDSGEVRIAKIERIIEECKFGIHDISEVTLDKRNKLPRFNMPLELGMFMGCKRFGGAAQGKKICLILDVEQYRYQKFISDIAGQDIRAHGGEPDRAIHAVRNWLATASKRKSIPGGAAVIKHYKQFRDDLPRLCAEEELRAADLTFSDLSKLIIDWLQGSR